MKFGLEQDVIDLLTAAFEDNPKVDKAYMFGSRAMGNYRPSSDIDIAIKGQDIRFDDIISMSAAFEEKGITYKIDLLDYHDINEPALKEHIDRVGIEFYSRWRVYKLGEIASYVNRGVSPLYVEEDGIPIINQKCIRNGRIDFSLARLTSKSKNYTPEKKLIQNDLVINSTGVGTAGRVSRFLRNNLCYADTHVSILRINEELANPAYVFFNLNSREDEIENYAEGSTGQIELGRDRIKDIEIILPPISEQNIIASILSSLDDKIDLLHRQNKTLEQLAETLFRQWFVEEAKESWKETTLYNVIDLVGGGTPKTEVTQYWAGNIKWITAKDISANHKRFIYQTEKTITKLGLENSSTSILDKYCMIISARGTLGKYCLLSEPMAFSQTNYGIKPKFKNCYFFTYLLIEYSVLELQAASYGSIFDTITTNTFKEHKVKIPSEKEIANFESYISSYFLKMLSNANQIRVLNQLRDKLLPKLMSGEIRVEYN